MSFPADVTFVQLIGTCLDGSGLPAYAPPGSGVVSRVVVTPLIASRLADYGSNVTIMPQRQTIYLDPTGSVPTSPVTQVIATDCPALAGVGGFQYALAYLLFDSTGQQLAPFTSMLTAQAGSGPIDIFAPWYTVTGSNVGNPTP